MEIDLQGPCTIAQSATLRETLLVAITEGRKTVLRFSGIEEVDLAFFQVLHAANASFRLKNIPLVFSQDLPSRLGDKARRCGWGEIVATTLN